MVDITEEMNADYYRRVGELVCRLTDKADFVKLGRHSSVLADDMVSVQVYKLHKGKTKQIGEAFTRSLIMDIPDMRVVADAIIKKLEQLP